MGGLTTALFLHRKGISCTVYEAAREIRELGVGINVLPHATKELDGLGLLPALTEAGILTREVVRYDANGKFIATNPRGRFGGYNWPQVSIHRGGFQRILLDAVVERLGASRVITNRRLTGFEERGGKVVARFVDRDGASYRPNGDVLIAADGIHSRARRIFYPNQGDPAYSGIMMWRATSRAKPFLTGSSMVAVGTKEQKWVAYPISQPDGDGLCTINWLAELPRPEMIRPEEWNRPGKLEDFYLEFADWAWDWCDAAAIMRAADAVYEFPMVDRDPIPQWTFGRVTLLGDAAHPMYPVGSNGSSQAILDASCIADMLVTHADPEAALKAYEAERLPATTKTVEAHRERQQETEPQSAEELVASTERFQKTVGFDVATVNRS
jgi:2-polyprenyl-6-methoxyphenol hydroxylase-like FAD-dependent oxidoreductase